MDRAFLKVLIQAASQAEAVQLGNPPFDAGLAAAADTLSQKGYTANRLLIPQGYLFRLRQMGVVVADNQVRSKHYAGSALGGLLVFCSVDLPPDEIFLFDSRLYAALMGKRDFERLDQGRRPFTREVVGRVRFNAIVKDTRAVVKLVGLETALVAMSAGASGRTGTSGAVDTEVFVDPNRMAQLREVSCAQYDLQKLIRLCEEINASYGNRCYLAVAMLLRAILDHVPPIFHCSTFAEVGNNYKGTRSFKDAMQHLEKSCRKIADAYLHTQIREKESLPTKAQVQFVSDLDTLLAEIVRIL